MRLANLKASVAFAMLGAILITAFIMKNVHVLWSIISIPFIIGMLDGLNDDKDEG